MNRRLFQEIADERAKEALTLLNGNCWSGAYYIAGYAIECALKACVAKQTNQHDFPDKDRAQLAYTHCLTKLVRLALLNEDLHKTQRLANPSLYKNWLVVKDWTVEARYEQWSEDKARALYLAVTDSDSGVLPWIKRYW